MGITQVETIEQRMQQEFERRAMPEGVPPLPEIPAGRYTDPAFFELEVEALKKSWLFGLHGDEIPRPGCYREWRQLGQPLIFVRGEDHRVRCFYNICRHRASGLVKDGCGEKRHFSCPLHGWTYRLDGTLAGAPQSRDFSAEELRCRSLIEVRCENFGELYFINFDADARPLLEDIAPIARAWALYRPEASRFVARVDMTVNANYKLVQEANMEVYHVTTVHPAIVSQFLDPTAAPVELYRNGHSIQASRLRKQEWTDSEIRLPGVAEATKLSRLANVAYHMFPNRIMAMNDWGYPLQSYWPIDARTTHVETVWIAPKTEEPLNATLWNEITGMFTTVLEQDYEYIDATQRAVESGACSGLLMGAQERTIYNMHEELDRRIGVGRVPAHLRVKPLLAGCLAD